MIRPGVAKVAIPGAAVALVVTGSAAALPDQHVKFDTSIASSSLQLSREAQVSRDALRPPLDVAPSQTPAPKPKSTPSAKHLKKAAPIPKPTATKTRAAASATPPKRRRTFGQRSARRL